jgi:hypothetical protein
MRLLLVEDEAKLAHFIGCCLEAERLPWMSRRMAERR